MNFNESFLCGLEFPEDVDNVELDWEFFYSRELPFDWNCTNVLNDNIFFCLLVEKQALKEQGLAFVDLHNGLFSLALDGDDHRSGVVFDCDDELESGQEKMVSIRMKSLVELKLFTNNSTTDINMEILEGKTLELFKPVPINVNANIVYSKYSMNPAKSINFGPI